MNGSGVLVLALVVATATATRCPAAVHAHEASAGPSAEFVLTSRVTKRFVAFGSDPTLR